MSKARAPKAATDQLIINRRRDEEVRGRMLEHTQYNVKESLKAEFEQTTNEKITRNHIHRRLEELKAVEESRLDARRERLRALLKSDMERYQHELSALEETPEVRVERMRERAIELRERREQERQKLAEEKYLQKWRADCDAIRQMESKALQKEVLEIRVDQLKEQEASLHKRKEEDRHYAELWEQDRLRKEAIEKAEWTRRHQLDAAMLAALDEQVATMRLKEDEAKSLKAEEAALMREEARLQKLDEERQLQEKRAVQEATRNELNYFTKLRMKQKSKEIQANLEADLNFLAEVMKGFGDDVIEKQKKKQQLQEEAQHYREYLHQQREVEKQRERELENLRKEEEDRAWRVRAEQWNKEHRARGKLMKEVLQARQEQIRAHLNENQERQIQAEKEREELLRNLKIKAETEEAEREMDRKNRLNYRQALREQIAYKEAQLNLERQREERENDLAQEAEENYNRLLQQELSKTTHSKNYVGKASRS